MNFMYLEGISEHWGLRSAVYNIQLRQPYVYRVESMLEVSARGMHNVEWLLMINEGLL